VTVEQFEQNLGQNIRRLKNALCEQQYRSQPVQRIDIPKGNGKTRSLGLPTTEDKLAQQAVGSILQSIWEPEFKQFSYGYRPRKSAHRAVHSLSLNLQYKKVGYIVEADIKGFFDNMDHNWLFKMLQHKIDDQRLIGLIKQWLKARIIQPDGSCTKPNQGTPQGGVISPVLANIYLHYVLDLWFVHVVKPRLKGFAMLVRYADDFIVAFQSKSDAERFYRVLPKRLNRFGLTIAQEKTRLIKFNRFSPGRERHFRFLGFEFYWEKTSKGRYQVRRRTARKKQIESIQSMVHWIKRHRDMKLNVLMPMIKRKLQGFQNYFGLPDNGASLTRFSKKVTDALYKWLNRRSQRRSYNWPAFKLMLLSYGVTGLKTRPRQFREIDWY
jgi:group II intron reverse transcriptase/maturase